MDDIKYPEKKHDKKPEPAVPAPAQAPMGPSPEQPQHVLDVRNGVAEATHQPFVSLVVDGQAIRLSVGDATQMGMALFQNLNMATEDSILCSWLETRFGMDRLQAYQSMMQFQQYRVLMFQQQAALQQAAQRKAREG